MSHFSFIYNRVNRLKGVQEPGGIKTTFEYDKAGNRTAQIEVMAGAVKLTNYSYNNKNQLERETLQEAGKTIEKTYHYDANGNLVSKADHQIQALSDKDLENVALSLVGEGSTDALTLYQYNEYNQLIKTITGNQTIAYGYNIEGYRDAKHTITQNKIGSISEETLLFIYDGSKVILETDITGNIKAENTYGLNLIARKADNEKAYYLYNAHGDVTALTDPAGKILGTYQYDAFGNIREKTYEKPNPYTYAGYRYDEEIDLYYLNARYYDPKIARFITQDTYKGQLNDPLSLNLYTYCANNPISYYDPTGFAYVWNRYGEIIGTTSGNKDYTDYSKAATDTHGGSHMADKEWSSSGSKSSSSSKSSSGGSSKSGSSGSSGSNSQTSSSSYVMKSNQFNETIYKLVGLTTYFALKSTSDIAGTTSGRESIVSRSGTLVASAGSITTFMGKLLAYEPDNPRYKLNINNVPLGTFESDFYLLQHHEGWEPDDLWPDSFDKDLTPLEQKRAIETLNEYYKQNELYDKIKVNAALILVLEGVTYVKTKNTSTGGNEKWTKAPEGTSNTPKINTTTNSKILPTGEANSITRRVDSNGKVISERYYDSNGRVIKDIHYTDHGNPKNHPQVPHEHKWDWSDPKNPKPSK